MRRQEKRSVRYIFTMIAGCSTEEKEHNKEATCIERREEGDVSYSFNKKKKEKEMKDPLGACAQCQTRLRDLAKAKKRERCYKETCEKI